MSNPEDDDQPQVPNVSLDTVRPPAPSAGDLYSSATVLRQVPQELIEAARARRRGRAQEVPQAPPPPAVPSFDPFPMPIDDAPSLEVGYADADEDTMEGVDPSSDRGPGRHDAAPGVTDLFGDDAPSTPRAFAAFGSSASVPTPAPSSRPTLPGPDSVRMIPAGPSSRPTPVGVDPAIDLLARARPSTGERAPLAAPDDTPWPSVPPPPAHRAAAHDPDHAAEAETAPLTDLDEEPPAFMTVPPGARGALGAVGVLVMALLLAAAVLLAMRAFD